MIEEIFNSAKKLQENEFTTQIHMVRKYIFQ